MSISDDVLSFLLNKISISINKSKISQKWNFIPTLLNLGNTESKIDSNFYFICNYLIWTFSVILVIILKKYYRGYLY